MKAAIYMRISTRDGKQTVENQRRELLEYAARRGWSVTREYSDQASGSAGPADRDALAELLKDAARRGGSRRFDVVLVWSLDRFTREGVFETFAYIRRLKNAGVQFVSITEEHFQTIGPAGDLLLAVSAWIADQERRRISERVHAGLDRAKAQGKRLGRPALDIDTGTLLYELQKSGGNLHAVARATGLSRTTLRRRIMEIQRTIREDLELA